MHTPVKVLLPLPLDLISSLMRAVGAMYPNTLVDSSDGNYWTLLISDEDRADPAPPDAEKVFAPTDADLEATLASARDGSFGISMPEWYSKMILEGAIAVLDDANADNYLEIPVTAQDGTTYLVTASRSQGQTPGALRRVAEARAEAADQRAELYAAELRRLGVDPDTLNHN